MSKELYKQVPAKVFARDGCKKCYGRGAVGFNRTENAPQPCTCLVIALQPAEEDKPSIIYPEAVIIPPQLVVAP